MFHFGRILGSKITFPLNWRLSVAAAFAVSIIFYCKRWFSHNSLSRLYTLFLKSVGKKTPQNTTQRQVIVFSYKGHSFQTFCKARCGLTLAGFKLRSSEFIEEDARWPLHRQRFSLADVLILHRVRIMRLHLICSSFYCKERFIQG